MGPDGATLEEKGAGYIDVTFRVYKEDGQYVSECTELGLASCGNTIDEAVEQLADAVELYLESIAEEGERERVFAERGIRVLHGDVKQTWYVAVHPDEILAARRLRIPTEAA